MTDRRNRWRRDDGKRRDAGRRQVLCAACRPSERQRVGEWGRTHFWGMAQGERKQSKGGRWSGVCWVLPVDPPVRQFAKQAWGCWEECKRNGRKWRRCVAVGDEQREERGTVVLFDGWKCLFEVLFWGVLRCCNWLKPSVLTNSRSSGGKSCFCPVFQLVDQQAVVNNPDSIGFVAFLLYFYAPLLSRLSFTFIPYFLLYFLLYFLCYLKYRITSKTGKNGSLKWIFFDF